MRVGVFLEQNIRVGGGFQQAYSVVELLTSRPLDGVEYVFFVFTRENHEILKGLGLASVLVGWSLRGFLHRGIRKLLSSALGLHIPFRGYVDELLDAQGIDLAYFLTPSWYAMGLKKCPFIYTVWDQCHRDWPEFPEVRAEFELREFLYGRTCPRAITVLVDSELSRQNMARRYGVDPERIHVAPFFPAPTADTPDDGSEAVEKYGLHRRPFVFYPAQLWPHKNHAYILEVLAILKTEGTLLDAVFTGTDFGNGDFLRHRVASLGLEGQVHWLGFVEREDIIGLYKKAIALVMPTYFGPTNIPPLEALQLGCPVCYPDLPGLRDQVGDAAFLMNLADPASLSAILRKILSDRAIVQEKIDAGRGVLQGFSKERYLRVVEDIFRGYEKILRLYS